MTSGTVSLPGFSLHGILKARILEGVAIPSPGNLHDPGIKPGSLVLQADSLLSESPGTPELPVYSRYSYISNYVVLNTIYIR